MAKKNEITIRSSAAEYADSELEESLVIRKFRITAHDGKNSK